MTNFAKLIEMLEGDEKRIASDRELATKTRVDAETIDDPERRQRRLKLADDLDAASDRSERGIQSVRGELRHKGVL